MIISIHAAREGGDGSQRSAARARCIFQSTPPVKAATLLPGEKIQIVRISIHAAREGGDGLRRFFARFNQAFQSTPPVKAATLASSARSSASLFQSTPPVKAATQAPHNTPRRFSISIHAAREGGDRINAACSCASVDFNPRRP